MYLQAERAEKEKVKRMTLEINERQEEEEAAEIMQQVISKINFFFEVIIS